MKWVSFPEVEVNNKKAKAARDLVIIEMKCRPVEVLEFLLNTAQFELQRKEVNEISLGLLRYEYSDKINYERLVIVVQRNTGQQGRDLEFVQEGGQWSIERTSRCVQRRTSTLSH